MKFDLKKRRIIAVAVSVLLVIVASAALFFRYNQQSKKQANAIKQETRQNKELNIAVNEDKTSQLKKEKAVSNGKVYVQNNKVIATMVIKDNVSDAEAKALAQKYANELKSQYKSMPVNVMAVKNNKNIANVTVK